MTSNTEICISLLTDREPQLTQIGCDPFDEQHGDWPAADWRLNGGRTVSLIARPC
jgi:hypothetical protein